MYVRRYNHVGKVELHSFFGRIIAPGIESGNNIYCSNFALVIYCLYTYIYIYIAIL